MFVILAKTDKGLGLINKLHKKIHGSNETKYDPYDEEIIKTSMCLLCVDKQYAEHIAVAVCDEKGTIGEKNGKEYVVKVRHDILDIASIHEIVDDHIEKKENDEEKSEVPSLVDEEESNPFTRLMEGNENEEGGFDLYSLYED